MKTFWILFICVVGTMFLVQLLFGDLPGTIHFFRGLRNKAAKESSE